MLTSLPSELVFIIFSFLTVHDVNNVAPVCKLFTKVVHNPLFWIYMYQSWVAEKLAEGVPMRMLDACGEYTESEGNVCRKHLIGCSRMYNFDIVCEGESSHQFVSDSMEYVRWPKYVFVYYEATNEGSTMKIIDVASVRFIKSMRLKKSIYDTY